MINFKSLGAILAALVLLNACGSTESDKTSAETGSTSINAGVKQMEELAAKEKQDAEADKETIAGDTADAEDQTASREKTSDTGDNATRSGKEDIKAASSDEPTPERTSIHTIVMQNKYGKVAFNHAAHTQFLSCGTCHPTEPPTRIEMSRKEFHAMCRTCHHEMGAGPVKCSSCHEH
jgi:hypothetical protein